MAAGNADALASALAERDSWRREAERLRAELNELTAAQERMAAIFKARGRMITAIQDVLNRGDDVQNG